MYFIVSSCKRRRKQFSLRTRICLNKDMPNDETITKSSRDERMKLWHFIYIKVVKKGFFVCVERMKLVSKANTFHPVTDIRDKMRGDECKKEERKSHTKVISLAHWFFGFLFLPKYYIQATRKLSFGSRDLISGQMQREKRENRLCVIY